MRIFAIAFVSATVLDQTLSRSAISFDEPTIIKVPHHVYVSGYLARSHPYYYVQRAVVHKRVLKFPDHAYDAERGIAIQIHGGRSIRDAQPIGDLSAFHLGVVSAGILLLLLFKLFK
ncbi:hypothetical protein PAPHI01_0091 [Pancytospora philotis]|nr:hypothetical protein PAPHI01_0091 [Pancytospora philotis]